MKLELPPRIRSTAVLTLAFAVTACTTLFGPGITRQFGESVILAGAEPARLAFEPVANQPVRVRSTYLPGPGTIEYEPGRDFIFDPSNRTIARTPGSRIPDFRTNMLYGQVNFDHNKFPGFGNNGFFAFVDYSTRMPQRWPDQPSQAHLLPATTHKLRSGHPVKIVAFGDSITAGGDATKPELIFWERWAAELRRQFPRASLTAANGATGGDNTAHGLQRFEAKVLAERPDLVLVAFGMNDHNRSGVPIPDFQRNLKEMISRIRDAGGEVVLLSAFPPNPNWTFGTQRMAEYAAATRQVAEETRCAYANVYDNWQLIAARKKPEDLLGNNINHPNDFGHWIYFRVLSELGLGR